MVALELQRELRKEIRCLTSHMRFKNPKGEDICLNVFKQNLPMRTHDRKRFLDEDEEEEEVVEYFPYCIVKLDSGTSSSAESAHLVKVIIQVGIYDFSVLMDGYKHILNIFEDIRERFRKNPVLANRFVAGDEMTWALADEDDETFPYFFGAMYMEWITAEFRREDELT